MPTLTRRLQILLDEERYTRLARLAETRKTSVATLVREALDAAFGGASASREAAGSRLLGAEPIDVGDWPELKAEIERMHEPTRE